MREFYVHGSITGRLKVEASSTAEAYDKAANTPKEEWDTSAYITVKIDDVEEIHLLTPKEKEPDL